MLRTGHYLCPMEAEHLEGVRHFYIKIIRYDTKCYHLSLFMPWGDWKLKGVYSISNGTNHLFLPWYKYCHWPVPEKVCGRSGHNLLIYTTHSCVYTVALCLYAGLSLMNSYQKHRVPKHWWKSGNSVRVTNASKILSIMICPGLGIRYIKLLVMSCQG